MAINQPPSPDAFLENLRQAWTEALIPGSPDRYLTVITNLDQFRAIGVVKNYRHTSPELILPVNPAYSPTYLARNYNMQRLAVTEELESLIALLNLQAYSRQVDEQNRGGGHIDFFMSQFDLRRTRASVFNSPPFHINSVTGPQVHHVEAAIFVSPDNRTIKRLIGRGKNPDVVINFASQLYEQLRLSLTPYSKETFNREYQTALSL